jgi:hypothetical protein
MTKSQAILLLQIQTSTSKLRDLLNHWDDQDLNTLQDTISEQIELLQDLRSIS